MRMTIYVGGAAAIFVCLALILAIPDLSAVLQQKDVDPVSTILIAALGRVGFRAVLAVVLVSFVSCILSLQAAASRLLFAYARDEMVVGSRFLSRVSSRTHVPANALVVCGIVPALIALAGLWLEHAVGTIISFASAGIYLAFQMLVVAALIARARGWQPAGAFRLGVWAIPVNAVALVFGLAAVVDMSWPRIPTQPWYINYGIIVGGIAILGSGLIYMMLGKPYGRGNAPAGDAHLLHASGPTRPIPELS
jgi:amino acid transporter